MRKTASLKKPIVNFDDIKKLKRRDNVFIKISKLYGNPPNWNREPGFISLCMIILEQQVSLMAAKAHFLKLNSYLKGISPRKILKLSDAEMFECQISRQKAVYLRELASAVIEKRIIFDQLETMDAVEIKKQLTGIKGIGDWTSDIYLMFCLQQKDIFPFGDIAVINTVKELFAVETAEEIKLLVEKWKPYRSLAAYFFWHYYLRKRNRN